MKRYILVLACLLAATVALLAQWSDFSTKTGSANLYNAMNSKPAVRTGTAVPTLLACTKGLDFYVRTGTVGLYVCDATDHWALVVTSVFGRSGVVVATSGDYSTNLVTESGNLYYLDSRARAAFSATSPVTLSAGGVIACATCKTADAVSTVFTRAGNVVATSGDYNTGQVTEVGNLYYTDVRARAAFSGTSPITVSAGGVVACATCNVTSAVANTAAAAYASSTLTLTTSYQDVPGATLTLGTTGTYLIHGVWDFNLQGAGDVGTIMLGQLLVNGVAPVPVAVFSGGIAGNRATVAQQWVSSVTAGQVVKLQAEKTTGTGTSGASIGTTGITAVLIAP